MWQVHLPLDSKTKGSRGQMDIGTRFRLAKPWLEKHQHALEILQRA